MFYHSSFVTIDVSNKPLVITTYHEDNPMEVVFDEYLEAYKRLCEEGSDLVIIFNASLAKNMQADLRIKQSKWIEKNRKLIQKAIRKAIFIIPNSFVRVILKGIFLLSRPPYDYSVVSNMDEAIEEASSFINYT
jgi:UDP-N-acetylglucosamine 2-epimerase